MPRAHRVGDIDSPSGDRAATGSPDIYLNEGGKNNGLAEVDIASLLGYSTIEVPEAEVARLYRQVEDDRRRGIRTDTQEYLEGTDGASATQAALPPAQIGAVQEPPPGAEGAHPDWNTFDLIPNNQYVTWVRPEQSRVDPAIYEIARRMAVRLQTTLQCNSGYRSRQYNASLRPPGATNSKHMYGKAMDLAYIGSSPEDKQRMLVAAIQSGAQGIGLYNSFIHIDLGPKRTWNRPQPSWASATMNSAGYA